MKENLNNVSKKQENMRLSKENSGNNNHFVTRVKLKQKIK